MTDLLKRVYTCLQILNFKQTRQLRHDDIDIKNNQYYKIAEFNIDYSIFLYQTKFSIYATPTS